MQNQHTVGLKNIEIAQAQQCKHISLSRPARQNRSAQSEAKRNKIAKQSLVYQTPQFQQDGS